MLFQQAFPSVPKCKLVFVWKPCTEYVIAGLKMLKNLCEATAHQTQFPPAKFPVHPSASQADGGGGGVGAAL